MMVHFYCSSPPPLLPSDVMHSSLSFFFLPWFHPLGPSTTSPRIERIFPLHPPYFSNNFLYFRVSANFFFPLIFFVFFFLQSFVSLFHFFLYFYFSLISSFFFFLTVLVHERGIFEFNTFNGGVVSFSCREGKCEGGLSLVVFLGWLRALLLLRRFLTADSFCPWFFGCRVFQRCPGTSSSSTPSPRIFFSSSLIWRRHAFLSFFFLSSFSILAFPPIFSSRKLLSFLMHAKSRRIEY